MLSYKKKKKPLCLEHMLLFLLSGLGMYSDNVVETHYTILILDISLLIQISTLHKHYISHLTYQRLKAIHNQLVHSIDCITHHYTFFFLQQNPVYPHYHP